MPSGLFAHPHPAAHDERGFVHADVALEQSLAERRLGLRREQPDERRQQVLVGAHLDALSRQPSLLRLKPSK
jgi:hypothetical protein